MAPLSLPLFPLGLVLYPGVVLPLHIFEERYRTLVRELVDLPEGSRTFGVVAIKAGREVGVQDTPDVHEIGCTAELRYVEAYPDGRFDIIAAGMTRFRLLGLQPAEPIRAQVELLVEKESAASRSLATRVARLFVDYREALLTAQGLQDEGDEVLELPDDPGELAYLVAAAMILDLSDKQRLLAAATVDERLRLEVALLRREGSMVSGLSLRPAVELPRLPHSSN